MSRSLAAPNRHATDWEQRALSPLTRSSKVLNPDQGRKLNTTNLLLGALSAPELERIWPRLMRIKLIAKTALMLADEPVENVYFIEDGTVSMITTLPDGTRIEAGMVGFEGMIGLPILLGVETSWLEAMVQIDGSALCLGAAAFRVALPEMPTLRRLLLRYVDAFHAQVTQSAACNSRHSIEQRLSRWLLTAHDRVRSDSFHMTQEFLSTMLGVRREGVTVAMGSLQRAGLVQHRRGKLRVLDRAALEKVSCGCHEVASQRSAWLMPPLHSPIPGS